MRTCGSTTHSPSHRGRGKPYRILCVDDQEPVSQALRCVLDQAGYVVECVADGQQALDRIIADLTFFDLLIIDHQMPRLSGLALVGHLRKASFPGRIIVQGSALSAEEISAYRTLGVDHVVFKPAKLAALLNCVDCSTSN